MIEYARNEVSDYEIKTKTEIQRLAMCLLHG